jgi:AraC family transcriptional regulator
MTMTAQTLASGPGWCVRDFVCSAGPHDRPFEERHEAVCIAAVAQGTFQYRSSHGVAFLAPGAVLLGNYDHCFECSHEHGVGDRCISVHLAPEFWEAAIASVPGARTAVFSVPRLPPLPSLIPVIAALAAASRDPDAAQLEELTLRLAGEVAHALYGVGPVRDAPSGRVLQRIADAVRRIESEADESTEPDQSLASFASDAAMSPYHFLRVFRDVVGMTPHQFVLRTRMHRAAVRLRRSDEPVSGIAFDAGFNDLSTFNRRFRRIVGITPTAFRARRRARVAGVA